MVAELMVLLRVGLGMFQVVFTRFTFLHDPPARAMAKRTADEREVEERDRSP